MTSTPSRHRSVAARIRKGFTLIELLTVIAIIGILAAIIIPTVSSVREKAKSAHCMSRLRAWGGAISVYANEHKGSYWATRTDGFVPWCVSLGGTVPGVSANPYTGYFSPSAGLGDWIYCPSRMDAAEISGNTPDKAGYVMIWPSYNGAKYSDPTNIPFGRASTPSRTILMMDRYYSSSAGVLVAGQTGTGATFSQDDLPKMTIYKSFDRHNGSINTLFFDGHVKSLKWADLASSNSVFAGVDVKRLTLD